MIGVYVRVSTAGQNVDGQKSEIQRWLKGHGIQGERWFIDKCSGSTLNRPAFEQLEAAIFHGEIETVVLWKLDRLSRNLRDGVNILASWCERGLRVVSVTQQIDFNGTTGKLIAAVLLGVAQMEQEMRKERQAVGISVAKSNGVYLGRRAGTWKSNPSRVLELHNKGLKNGEIASSLGISRRTVQRYLKLAPSVS